MKKVLVSFTIAIIIAIVLYLLASFICYDWSWCAKLENIDGRSGLVIIWFFFASLAVSGYCLYNE